MCELRFRHGPRSIENAGNGAVGPLRQRIARAPHEASRCVLTQLEAQVARSSRQGQLDRHAEARSGVLGDNASAVQRDGPSGDREAEADAAAGAAAVTLDAEEGVE